MDKSSVVELAEALRNATKQCQPIAPIGHKLPDSRAAYDVQEVNTCHWVSGGRRLVGRKIGATSQAVQKLFGLTEPDYGMLFDDMAFPDGWEISSKLLIQPKLEAEVAFVLNRDFDEEQITPAEIIAGIEFALPAIEIVDSRISDWKISLQDTIADNASSGLYVVGNDPKRLYDLDLRNAGMTMEVGRNLVSTGCGAACLGNPLNAVWWLARVMAKVGRPLKAGDTVMSGALGPMAPVTWNELVKVRIEGLGEVRVTLTS